jgi:hypothetical protein
MSCGTVSVAPKSYFSWAAAEITASAEKLKVASFISRCRRFRISASTIDRYFGLRLSFGEPVYDPK